MNNFIKDVENALLNNDVLLKEIMRLYLKQAVNQLLHTELTAVLGYQSYQRTMLVMHKIDFKMPYSRSYTHRIDSLDTTIIQLYFKEITIRKIANLTEKICGNHYSTTVSSTSINITKLVEDYHQHQFKHSQYSLSMLLISY